MPTIFPIGTTGADPLSHVRVTRQGLRFGRIFDCCRLQWRPTECRSGGLAMACSVPSPPVMRSWPAGALLLQIVAGHPPRSPSRPSPIPWPGWRCAHISARSQQYAYRRTFELLTLRQAVALESPRITSAQPWPTYGSPARPRAISCAPMGHLVAGPRYRELGRPYPRVRAVRFALPLGRGDPMRESGDVIQLCAKNG